MNHNPTGLSRRVSLSDRQIAYLALDEINAAIDYVPGVKPSPSRDSKPTTGGLPPVTWVPVFDSGTALEKIRNEILAAFTDFGREL